MTTKVYSTCPGPFVIPEDPNNSKVRWVDGTNCAYPCRNPIYSKQEYALFERTADVTSIIGLSFVTILIISWSLDKKHHKKGLILILAYFSAITSAGFLLTSNQSYEGRFCSSNAVPIDSTDGVTTCAAQSFLLFYAGLAACYAWCAIAVALFFKVVMNAKILQESYRLWIAYGLVVFGLPMMPALYIFSTDSYGYGGNLPWCLLSVRHSSGVDLYLYIIPVILIIVIGIICQTTVIFVILRTRSRVSKSAPSSSRNQSNSLISSYLCRCIQVDSDKLNSLKTPILFVICFLLVWVTTFTYRVVVIYYDPKLRDSFNEWKACLFDDETSDDWESRCGTHPRFRMGVTYTTLCIFLTCGQSIFLFITFFTIPSLTSKKRRVVKEVAVAKYGGLVNVTKSGNHFLISSNKLFASALNGIRRSRIFVLSGSSLFRSRPKVIPDGGGSGHINIERVESKPAIQEEPQQQQIIMPAPRLIEFSSRNDAVRPFSTHQAIHRSTDRNSDQEEEHSRGPSKGKYKFPTFLPTILSKFRLPTDERRVDQLEIQGNSEKSNVYESQRAENRGQYQLDVLEDGLEIFSIQNMFAGQYSSLNEDDYGRCSGQNSIRVNGNSRLNEEHIPDRERETRPLRQMISRVKFLAPAFGNHSANADGNLSASSQKDLV